MTILFKYPDKLDVALKMEMASYERFLVARWPRASVSVHNDWAAGAGHVADSQHYEGKAVDFHVVGVTVLDAWLALERFRFLGIGLYPFWKPIPGFHADVRSAPFRARWARDEKGAYVGFDLATLLSVIPTQSIPQSLQLATITPQPITGELTDGGCVEGGAA